MRFPACRSTGPNSIKKGPQSALDRYFSLAKGLFMCLQLKLHEKVAFSEELCGTGHAVRLRSGRTPRQPQLSCGFSAGLGWLNYPRGAPLFIGNVRIGGDAEPMAAVFAEPSGSRNSGRCGPGDAAPPFWGDRPPQSPAESAESLPYPGAQTRRRPGLSARRAAATGAKPIASLRSVRASAGSFPS